MNSPIQIYTQSWRPPAYRWRKKMIRCRIDAIDQQIDNLVYALYDLTEEEIAIVEG